MAAALGLVVLALGCEDPPASAVSHEAIPLRPPPAAPAPPPKPARETVALKWRPGIDVGRGLRVDITTDPKHRSVHFASFHHADHVLDVSMPLHMSFFGVVGPALNADQRRVLLVADDTGAGTFKAHARGPGKLKKTEGKEPDAPFIITETGTVMSQLDAQTLQMVGPILQLSPTPVGVGDTWPLTVGSFSIQDEDWSVERHDKGVHAKLTAIEHTPDGTFADIELEGDEVMEGTFRDMFTKKKQQMSQSLRGSGQFAVEAGTWKRLELTSTLRMSGLSRADVVMHSVITPVTVPAQVQMRAIAVLKSGGP